MERDAVAACDRKKPHLAAALERCRACHTVKKTGTWPDTASANRGIAAAIRHMRELDGGLQLQELAARCRIVPLPHEEKAYLPGFAFAREPDPDRTAPERMDARRAPPARAITAIGRESLNGSYETFAPASDADHQPVVRHDGR